MFGNGNKMFDTLFSFLIKEGFKKPLRVFIKIFLKHLYFSQRIQVMFLKSFA